MMSADRGAPGGAAPQRAGRLRQVAGGLRRMAGGLFALVFLLLLLEGAARIFLHVRLDAAWLHPDEVWLHYYPELDEVATYPPHADDDVLDVLLLGGSVIDRRWSPVGGLLARGLARRTRQPVRVHNLSFPAHTTRDSLLKYERLADHRFDLVVVYHGINEARANNVPPELFADDYSHYSWYRRTNALREHAGLGCLALPFVAHYAAIEIEERLHPDRIVPSDAPREDWVGFGSNILSADPFRRNLKALLELAESRGDRVLLMTFATWLPSGAEGEAFLDKPLAQGSPARPLRMWGAREHIEAATRAHNAAVRELAAQHPHLPFVDQQARMPRSEETFYDVCHLTESGSDAFVDGMLEALSGVALGSASDRRGAESPPH